MRDTIDLADVCHGDSLTANRIVRDAGEDQRNIFHTDSLNQLLELFNIHIALEGVLLIVPALGNLIEQLLVIQIARHGSHLLDIALCGIKMSVGRNGEDLTGVALRKNFLDYFHQNRLGCASLLNDEAVRALHLCRASVEQTALIFAEVDFIHHFLHIAAVGSHQICDLLPVFFTAALKDITEGIQKHIVSGIASVSLVSKEERRPLLVGHGCCSGIGEHVHCQHAGRKSKFIVVCGLQGAFALLDSDVRDIAHSESAVVRSGNVQGILFRHNTYLH